MIKNKILIAFSFLLIACSSVNTNDSASEENVHLGTTAGQLDAIETLSQTDSTQAEIQKVEEDQRH